MLRVSSHPRINIIFENEKNEQQQQHDRAGMEDDNNNNNNDDKDKDTLPVWRTDIETDTSNAQLLSNSSAADADTTTSVCTTTTERVHVVRTVTYSDDSLRDALYDQFECRQLYRNEMKRYHVVMLPMRNVVNAMRFELLKQAWQNMWRHVENEREKMVSSSSSS